MGCTLWLAGCTSTPAPAVEVAVEAAPVSPAPALPVVTPTKVEPPAKVEPPPKVEPEVRVIAPPTVAVTPVVTAGSEDPPRFPPVPSVPRERFPSIAPGWTVVREFDREVIFEPLASGVLCRVDGAPHELGPDGALVAKPAIDDIRRELWQDGQTVFGVWPGDAWRVRERSQDREGSLLTFMRWRGTRWVAQNEDSGYDENFVLYRWSPRSGVLVTRRYVEDETVGFERLAGKYDAPADMPLKEGQAIEDLFESAAGALFLFVDPQGTREGDHLDILRSCDAEAPGCERSGGVTVTSAEGLTLRPGVMTARGRKDISVAIDGTGYRTPDRHYLAHFEAGGWKLEPVPDDLKVLRLVPTADGGLWIVAGARLWHRGKAGDWAEVNLPERGRSGPLSLVLRDEQQVWLAVNAGEHHAIYAAPALPRPADASAPG